MSRNCSGVCSRDCAVTVALSRWPGDGRQAADLAGRDLDVLRRDRAGDVADGQLHSCASLSGSSQIRMAYCEPKNCDVADAGDAARAGPAMLGGDVVAEVGRWSCCRRSRPGRRSAGSCARDLATVEALLLHLRAAAAAIASCSLFCTCTWAVSGLVPCAKVSGDRRRAGRVARRREVDADRRGRSSAAR